MTRFLLFSFYLIIASITTHLYFDRTGEMIGTATESLVNGTEKKPFAYRVLVPTVMREIVEALPQSAIAKLEARKPDGSWHNPKAMDHFRWNGTSIPLFILSYFMVWGITLWILYCWRAVLNAEAYSTAIADIAPIFGLLLVPILLSKAGWIYDFPELLFFSLGLLFYLKKQWLPYYISFCLALLNKETAVLMSFYFLPAFACSRKMVFKHALVHAALAMVILFGIRLHFADRAGEAMQVNIQHNLDFLFSAKPWFKFSDTYAYQLPTPRGFNVLNFFLYVVPLWLARKQINKNWFYVVVAMTSVLFPLFLYSGFEDEFRVFLPVVPAYFLIYVQAVHYLFLQHYAKQKQLI